MDNSQQIYPETSSSLPPQLEPVTMEKGDSGAITESIEKPSFVEDDPQLALQGSTLMDMSDLQNQEFAKIKWLHFSAFLFFFYPDDHLLIFISRCSSKPVHWCSRRVRGYRV